MDKPPHPDYVYMDSESLKQRITYHKKSGWLICQDKYPDGKFVGYSPKELKIFEEAGEPTMEVHRVKQIFSGEVIRYERTGNKGKPVEGKQPDGSGKTFHNGGKIQGASGIGPIDRGGELDIY